MLIKSFVGHICHPGLLFFFSKEREAEANCVLQYFNTAQLAGKSAIYTAVTWTDLGKILLLYPSDLYRK